MANIKNELNNIKSAIYGKDVRGSIHDGIDAINKEVENTTGRQVDLENTFDQLVINAGNSNAEIVDARVKSDGTSYSKLGDRLNEVDSQLAHIENLKEVYVDDFGNDGNAIKQAIEELKKGGKLVFTRGKTYIQNIDTCFVFNNLENIIIEGNGATIIADENNPCTPSNRGFEFIRCKNITINNLNYNGNIAKRKPNMGDSWEVNNQSGFSFKSCKNICLTNVTSSYCCMDGFTLEGLFDENNNVEYNENISFRNCVGNYNYRQGTSVINANNITFDNCEFSHTGTIYGTAPMFGIDLEEGFVECKNRGQFNVNIRNCKFKNNNGYGVGAYFGTIGCNIDSCRFENNGVLISDDLEFKNHSNKVTNCMIINGNIIVNSKNNIIENNIINYTNGLRLLEISIANAGNVDYNNTLLKGNVFKNNTIECNLTDYNNKNVGVFTNALNDTIIENNVFKNIVSSNPVFNLTGQNTILKENVFLNNHGIESKIYCSNLRNFKEVKNNKFSGFKSSLNEIFNLNTNIEKFVSSGHAKSTFSLTSAYLSDGKSIDLYLGGKWSLGVVIVTFVGEENPGALQYRLYYDGSTTTKTLVFKEGWIDTSVDVGDFKVKDGLLTLPIISKNTSRKYGQVTIDIYTNGYLSEDNIKIGTPY